jgi:hypothetical protein
MLSRRDLLAIFRIFYIFMSNQNGRYKKVLLLRNRIGWKSYLKGASLE